MLETLLLVAALSIWTVVLKRAGGLTRAHHATLRILLGVIVAVQAGLYVAVTWQTRSVPLDQVPVVLARVQRLSDIGHGTSATLLLIVALWLGLSTFRLLRRGCP
jgi:hypothetical protein